MHALLSVSPKYPLYPLKDLLAGSCRDWLCGLRLGSRVSGGWEGARPSPPPPHLLQAFTTMATLVPMRLSVFLAPFAVKGLTNSKSAAERFKVSGQQPGCTDLCFSWSSAFTPTVVLLHVTPGQGSVQPGWRGMV